MFDFINTCISNYQDAAAHAPPIDWSGLGGVPWLLGMALASMALLCWAAAASAAAAREAARLELYDLAEAEGQLRAARRDERGYAEY